MMRLLTLIVISSAAIRASGLAGHSSEGGIESQSRLTLPTALALALKHSPELSAFSWDIRAAEARIIQARLLPNPELSVEAEDITGTREFEKGEEAERTLALSQLVELGGKRTARVEEARFGRELARWEYQVKRIEVLKNTTQAFVDVLAAQRKVELMEENVMHAERALALSRQLVQSGQGSAAQATRSDVAAASARIGIAQAKRELLSAKAMLAANWGGKSATFGSVSGDLDHIRPLPSLASLSARLARNPQLARWTTEREKRQATLRRAKAEAVPDLTLMVGPRLMGKGEDVTLGVVGVSIPLPLFNRNQGNIAEAKASISKAADERRAAEARAFAELNKAYQSLASAAEEVTTLNSNVLPGATQTVELLTQSYTAGQSSQLEILEARHTLTESRTQHLRALADYHKALAEVEALTAAPVELHELHPPLKKHQRKK